MNDIIPFIFIIGIPFWLWMLADAIKVEHKKRHHGHFWVLFIALTFLFGAIIYFSVRHKIPTGRRKNGRNKKN